MNSLILAVIVFVGVFAGGAVGVGLQRALPEGYTTGGARDMIGAVSGLITLLLALVLGLLIWTAFGVYSGEKTAIQTLALSGMKYDEALRDYGPEAAEGRRLLREGLARSVDEIWNDGDDSDFIIKNYTHVMNGLKAREGYLKTLQPTSDAQIAAKAAAGQAAIAMGQTRTQLALSLVDPINYPLLAVVVVWATILFCAYGLMAKGHPMTYIALAFGAVAIASAIYVIADLSSPYSGLFQVSPSPITDVLAAVEAATKPPGGHQ
ncbi:uncharacterized protein DUF4239 [Roseiarcus fermentans]|uniref:Uncharacterized protein DUF4239 n=1 Tax=Roseiarcus fermentans TaxID=1473586 RepID=A0A366F511_9HYPH|nr:DUF4239 domain-containing protein [Roseiarcus fermentans]RBP09742.1 uncharacterized protein DUF4239 [Roseiarcus fermentans]